MAERNPTKPRTTMVSLTDDELVVLDGQVSQKVQEAVDAAKVRIEGRRIYADLSPVLAGFVADVVAEATINGELVWQNERLTSCALCGRDDGYVPYKSGPNRGRPNYDRHRTFAGVNLAYRFVRVQGRAALGGCSDCVASVVPTLQQALRPVPAQLPTQLVSGDVRWVKWANVRCSQCDWTGHEGQMGKARTLMGGGFYPASCPSCGATNTLGYTLVRRTEGHTMVQVEAPGS